MEKMNITNLSMETKKELNSLVEFCSVFGVSIQINNGLFTWKIANDTHNTNFVNNAIDTYLDTCSDELKEYLKANI